MDVTHGLIKFFGHAVTIAVHRYLMTLTLHTEKYIDAQSYKKGQKLDIKTWSRQGCNLRAMSHMDAGNPNYSRTWFAARILMETIEDKKTPLAHRRFASMIRESCQRFPSFAGDNELKQGDMVEALLGVLRPWDMHGSRFFVPGGKTCFAPVRYPLARSILTRKVVSEVCTSEI